MPEKDFAVGTVSIPQAGAISKKPSYLVTLEGVSSNKKMARFITLDKPELLTGFIQVKGVFSDLSEDEIIADFISILASTAKESFLDMMFPTQKVCSIRSLVFNANKLPTIVKDERK